jgi:hypothetical protein
MQQLTSAQASPEVPINENFDTLAAHSVFGRRHPATLGLTWAYYGGLWGGITVADGTVALNAGATQYVVVARATGAVSVSTSTTNWLNVAQYARAHKIVTVGSLITSVEDHRAGLWGTHGPAARAPGVSADRGDTSQTLVPGVDVPTQRWATTLTANRTVTLNTASAVVGDAFRIVRTGLGAFTLNVGGLKTLPSATAAWCDVEYDGAAWRLTAYGTL